MYSALPSNGVFYSQLLNYSNSKNFYDDDHIICLLHGLNACIEYLMLEHVEKYDVEHAIGKGFVITRDSTVNATLATQKVHYHMH
jgi:hypothetical protein